jgi:amylosucrase
VHADDNRWMHRPSMDWRKAARRAEPGSLEGRVFAKFAALAGARRALLALRSGGETEILPTENRKVLDYRRVHPRSAPFLSLTNFSDFPQSADSGITARAGLRSPRRQHSTGSAVVVSADRIQLPPWSFIWLAGA